MTPLDAGDKERLIEEFRGRLEQWDAADAAPGESVDLATLLGEISALKNEVRLNSRLFKTALEDLRKLAEMLREHNERLIRDVERTREMAADLQRQAERRLLLGVLDLRDRLHAGAQAAAARRPSRLARLVPGETRFAHSLSQGLTLTLARLDELLATHRVRAIDAVGQPLDPQRMRAIGVESARDAPDGVVVSEARRGFLQDGELLRAAEVIVNRKVTPE